MMEHGACNIIYLDRRAREELVRRDTALANRQRNATESEHYFKTDRGQVPQEVLANIECILSTFNEVYVCRTGGSCLTKLGSLQNSLKENVPTIVLLDIPYDEASRAKRLSQEPRTPSPTSARSIRRPDDPIEEGDIYGMQLLSHIFAGIQSKTLSKLIVPIVVLSSFEREWASSNLPSPSVHGSQVLSDTVRLTRYIDAGAVDVLTSPLSRDHVQGLAVHAYRRYKEVSNSEQSFQITKKNRKISWVGVDDTKPYAYLREAMVSGLMGHICNPDSVGSDYEPSIADLPPARKAAIAASIGTWDFSAHDWHTDELLHGSLLMLQHALEMPELEQYRIPTANLMTFLQACRHAYNDFVLYHNFRHVVDVLQAVFYFLVRIGTLPPYPKTGAKQAAPTSAIASLLKPFDALTLLVSAIGHDVGHPGVNNAFLVALNAPLAQLYNDRSVLESFHCAAYSQILRRYWPSAFEDICMRRRMINSILATDMGLHFKYMTDLGNLQEKLAHNGNSLDGWNLKIREEYRDLTCGLLIKCADISNVARKFDVAAQWASILTDEFSNQGNMEIELNIPTQLFGGPPVLDNMIKMGESQIGFANIFARPLFEAVAHILPAMQFSVDEILVNKGVWEQKIEQEKEKQKTLSDGVDTASPPHILDGARNPSSEIPSPLSGSRVDLPGTEPLSTSLSADVAGQPTRDGSDSALTAYLIKQKQGQISPASIPLDKKRKESKGCTSVPRLRSLSPTKRLANRTKSHERSSSKHDRDKDPARPRTSPANTCSGNGNRNGTPYAQMNGHAVAPPLPPGHSDGASDSMPIAPAKFASSTTDVSHTSSSGGGGGGIGKGRMSSRFGFDKLWKKRWRGVSGTVRGVPSPSLGIGPHGEVNGEEEGRGR
ncbi:HD-domain/PDEase-like protein [Tothia fuscella]|uniref:Phosphodiesterase n=1 Tax=Tothia fuscella TaxID=1048955 RepID=A0A9P4NRC1_9PEZI|nr:HD-domain/PDEase-like protein [Tothia fuscella]